MLLVVLLVVLLLVVLLLVVLLLVVLLLLLLPPTSFFLRLLYIFSIFYSSNIENQFNHVFQRRLVERDFFLNTRLADFLYLREDFGIERRREPDLTIFLANKSLSESPTPRFKVVSLVVGFVQSLMNCLLLAAAVAT